MFRQQVDIFRGFITKEYKNMKSIYTFKTSHIESDYYDRAIYKFWASNLWCFERVNWCDLLVLLCDESTEDVGFAVAQLVEALRYKPEDRGFDSGCCHWDFSLT
jgi:hypothetical protein